MKPQLFPCHANIYGNVKPDLILTDFDAASVWIFTFTITTVIERENEKTEIAQIIIIDF